jgi:hypothetical protein
LPRGHGVMSCFRCLRHLELFLYHGNRAPTRSFWNSTSETVSAFPTRPDGLELATGSSAAMSQRFVRLRALCAWRFLRWNASVIPQPDLTRDQSEGRAPHLRVRKDRLDWRKGIFFFRDHVPSQIFGTYHHFLVRSEGRFTRLSTRLHCALRVPQALGISTTLLLGLPSPCRIRRTRNSPVLFYTVSSWSRVTS